MTISTIPAGPKFKFSKNPKIINLALPGGRGRFVYQEAPKFPNCDEIAFKLFAGLLGKSRSGRHEAGVHAIAQQAKMNLRRCNRLFLSVENDEQKKHPHPYKSVQINCFLDFSRI